MSTDGKTLMLSPVCVYLIHVVKEVIKIRHGAVWNTLDGRVILEASLCPAHREDGDEIEFLAE
jgi:hypothetical protein